MRSGGPPNGRTTYPFFAFGNIATEVCIVTAFMRGDGATLAWRRRQFARQPGSH